MTHILDRQQIERLVSIPAILKAVEEGFVAYSSGEAVVAAVGALHFDNPPGDCHLKSGYLKRGKYYVVKVASGFYNNPARGLPAGNGVMLLFDQQTGGLVAVLLDEGYLTDLRTAAAGAIAAKYLAPRHVDWIGIVGTGAQAYFQLHLLASVTTCRQVMVWGRDRVKAKRWMEHPGLSDWKITIAKDLDELTAYCRLIVTTTSSSTPLIFPNQIQPGTHLTAVGADDVGKQELHPKVFLKADTIIVDSRAQSIERGDLCYALQQKLIDLKQVVELGEVVMRPSLGRTSDAQITVLDLTGIAIQDLQIASTLVQGLI